MVIFNDTDMIINTGVNQEIDSSAWFITFEPIAKDDQCILPPDGDPNTSQPNSIKKIDHKRKPGKPTGKTEYWIVYL